MKFVLYVTKRYFQFNFQNGIFDEIVDFPMPIHKGKYRLNRNGTYQININNKFKTTTTLAKHLNSRSVVIYA